MEFAPESFVIAGVALIPLTFGLVEFIKSLFNLNGKTVTVISASTGAVLYALYESLKFIPEPYNTIVVVIVGSIAFGLSASGFYKFAESRKA